MAILVPSAEELMLPQEVLFGGVEVAQLVKGVVEFHTPPVSELEEANMAVMLPLLLGDIIPSQGCVPIEELMLLQVVKGLTDLKMSPALIMP